MTGKFPFKIQSKYAHLKPADVHLWEKFVKANAGFFDSVDYDFAVGPAPSWMDTKRDEYAAKQVKLYQKKIDVVGYKDDIVWLIEVKPQAGSTALGQILSYRKLFLDEYGDEVELRLGVITNQCQEGYCDIFAAHNVRCFHVGFCSQCQHYPSV